MIGRGKDNHTADIDFLLLLGQECLERTDTAIKFVIGLTQGRTGRSQNPGQWVARLAEVLAIEADPTLYIAQDDHQRATRVEQYMLQVLLADLRVVDQGIS